MVNFKEDERLNTLNHSCAHVMAQAVKHLYPDAKFWVGPVVKEGFYYDIDLGDNVINDDAIEAIEKEMKKICKEGKKIYRREVSKEEALEMFKDDMGFFARVAMRIYRESQQLCLHRVWTLHGYSRSTATVTERSSGT